MDARKIIDCFGGQTALGDLLGKGASTVAYWAKTGTIPARWQPKLLLLALKRGIPLTASDFVDAPPSVPPDIAIPPEPQVHTSLQSGEPVAIDFKADGKVVKLQFDGGGQAIWATAIEISEIFETDATSIRKHLGNIYDESELDETATRANFARVQFESGREVKRTVAHYNLDAILSVGYRVNAKRATQFRQWATQILRTYMDQGYVINEKALRESPEKLDRLASKIRALRSEEKQVYAKVRECFKISSSDYDPESRHVKSFYALLQDKFHHAVTGSTASKLIMDRADHHAANMGLQTMAGPAPTVSDATAGKNYLFPEELYKLHLLSEQFLLYAESTALAGRSMTMESLQKQLDRLLVLNEYPVFEGYKDFLRDEADKHARVELGSYRKRKKIEALGLTYDEDALEAGEYDAFLMDH